MKAAGPAPEGSQTYATALRRAVVGNAEALVTPGSPFRWTSAARSHVGLVRDMNEDACLDRPGQGLWAVADGMGGHAVGDFASRKVVEGLNGVAQHGDLASFAADARTRLQGVNRDLRAEAAARGVPIIGSTVAVLLARDRRCACLWAGDSRIYRLGNGRLRQLTRDHSQVEELKSRGQMSAAEALHYPGRNLITRAVGATDALDLDEAIVDVSDGDVFLLCSDGLTGDVSEQDIGAALLHGDCEEAAKALITLALQAGGRDNVTAIVVRAEDPYWNDKTLLNPAL